MIMTINKRHISLLSLILLSLIFFTSRIQALTADNYATESMLSKGNWAKIKVSESSIHAISQSELSKWGFKDINKVKIFGYGGAPISIVLNAKQIDDLIQIPVLNTGKNLIFYAQGVTTWRNGSKLEFVQYQHPYATEAFYFITDRDDITQLSISEVSATPVNGGNTITTYTECAFYEKESTSPCESGHYLVGDDFRFTTSRDYKFNLDNYITGSPIKVKTAFAAKITGGNGGLLSFSVNGNKLEETPDDNIESMPASGNVMIKTTQTVKEFTSESPNVSFSVKFSSGGTVNSANLDFITVNYTAQLTASCTFNTSSATSKQDVITLSGANENTHVWDITTHYKPTEITGSLNGNEYSFSPIEQGARKYIAFDANKYTQAKIIEKTSNQNIHGEATPDMIIITPTEFKAQAQRIADLHTQLDSMRVLVVEQHNVFNEFSSGTPDFMAYRKMAKMFYDRGSDEMGHKLGYILLFGRGTYDNRKLSSTVKTLKYPMLLTWQTDNGSDEISSFFTDDILGMMDDGSGTNINADKMNIAVGRMPIKSVTEARYVVDKLYSYTTKQDFGTWKNNILVIADDMNNAIHMKQGDNVISTHKQHGGQNYIYNRIYLDAFEVEGSGAGRSFPEARKKLFQKLNEGVLYLNYIGHSGNVAWTGDGLLNINDINNMYLKHYPLFLTASCEFTRLDKASVTGGEALFLNPRGGAIALISTARQVYISDNGTLNESIAKYMFACDKNGKHYRLGDILRLGKNAIGSNNNKLKFFLIGDPALRLSYPTYGVNLESINGVTVSNENMPILKARQSITVKGHIVDEQGNKATTFNGSVIPTLYDTELEITTHGYGDDGEEYIFLDRSNKLSVSKDSVINGEFTVKVAIPSEINAPSAFDNYTPALLNFYASSNDGIEANGNNEQFYIYGYDSELTADTIGPEINMFVINSEIFKNGDDINESPLVLANIADESGINLSNSGIGHQMTLLLDDVITYSDVSSYYTPDFTSTGNQGTIAYNLNNLSEGEHTLRLKVWDTFNNSSEKTINFNVINGLKPEMYDVYAVGNPASVDTKFYIKHNRPEALITVSIFVYDLMGRLVWSSQESGKSDMFTSFPITWNLTDMSGRRVPRGIYIYKAGISTDGIQETTKAKKIAVAAE